MASSPKNTNVVQTPSNRGQPTIAFVPGTNGSTVVHMQEMEEVHPFAPERQDLEDPHVQHFEQNPQKERVERAERELEARVLVSSPQHTGNAGHASAAVNEGLSHRLGKKASIASEAANYIAISKARRGGIILGETANDDCIKIRAYHSYGFYIWVILNGACVVPTILVVGAEPWIAWLVFTLFQWICIKLNNPHPALVPFVDCWETPGMFDCISLDRIIPKKWPNNFNELFGLEKCVKKPKERLPYYLAEMCHILLFWNALLNIIQYEVWYYQLPFASRRSEQDITTEIQLNPDYMHSSQINSAEMFAAYTGAHPLTLLAGGIVLLYICTKARLSDEGKKVLATRRAFLCKFKTSIGSGEVLDKIIQGILDKGFQKIHSKTRSLFSYIAFALALFNSVVPVIFQNRAALNATIIAPGVIGVYIVTCLTVGGPAAYVCYWALCYVAAFFIESAEWLNQMRFLPIDFTDALDLLWWQELRLFYIRWVIPVQYARAAPGFGAVMLLVGIVLTALVVLVFWQGTAFMVLPGAQMAWFICIYMMIFLINCLVAATSVWNRQQEHTMTLSDAMLKVRFRLALTATPTLKNFTAANQIDRMSENISDVSTGFVSHTTKGASSQSVETKYMQTKKDKEKKKEQAVVALPPKAPKANRQSDKAYSPLRIESFDRADAYAQSVAAAVHDVMDIEHKGLHGNQATRYNQAYLESLLSLYSDQIEAIEKRDPAPQLFGMNIKPTLLQVVAGYCATAIAAIVGKFVTTNT